MDFVGIMPSALLENEPKGYRPSEYLPSAKSIIVFGRRVIGGSIHSMLKVYDDGQLTSRTSYTDHATYLSVNMLLLYEMYKIAQYLETNLYCMAVPLPNNALQGVEPEDYRVPFFADPYKAGLPINIYKAAVLAGLGEIGWSHRFLTPDDGPRVHLCAILTDIEFDSYDDPYAGEKLCDPSKCGICFNKCPTQAISKYPDGIDMKIGNEKKSVCNLDVNACTVACMGLSKRFNPRPDYESSSDHPTDSELSSAIRKMEQAPGIQSLDHLPSYYCDKCLIYCPVGDWDKKYKRHAAGGDE